MRLNSALVSSFLFGAIVLADDDPEKPQRRLVNRIDKRLNATLPVEWVGLSQHDQGGYMFVIGTFSVPRAWDHDQQYNYNLGVGVAVAIGGASGACSDTSESFWVGVDVFLTDNNLSYAGWASWGTQVQWSTEFDIEIGDTIRASIRLNSTTSGSAWLENLSKQKTWNATFTAENDQSMLCRDSVEWAVTPLGHFPSDIVPIPKFSTVTFVNISAVAMSRDIVNSDGGTINNFMYQTSQLATAAAAQDVVVVVREMY